MTNKARTTQFDIPNLAFAGVSDDTTTGFAKLAARENAPNPRYVAVITDTGELFLYDKDGSKLYGLVGSFAGHGSPDELSVNKNKIVCIRSGTSLALINIDGTLRWNFTGPTAIANLVAAKVGSTYVACFINTGVPATSGVQWRSLVNGSIVQAVYGVGGATITSGLGGIAVGETGARAAIIYERASRYTRTEHHEIVAGRLWSIEMDLGGSGTTIFVLINVDKDCGYTIASAKQGALGVGGWQATQVFDNTGALLGWPSGGANSGTTYVYNCMSVDGRLAGMSYSTTTPANFFYRVVVVPFTSSLTTPSGVIRGLDVSDDDLYFLVGISDGNIRVYRVDGYIMGTQAYGGTQTPIAVVRNYA